MVTSYISDLKRKFNEYAKTEDEKEPIMSNAGGKEEVALQNPTSRVTTILKIALNTCFYVASLAWIFCSAFMLFLFSGFIYANDIDDTQLLRSNLRLFLNESGAEFDIKNSQEGVGTNDCTEIANKYIKGSKAEILISALEMENFHTNCELERMSGKTVDCESKNYTLESFEENFWHRDQGLVALMHYLSIVVDEGQVVDIRCTRLLR